MASGTALAAHNGFFHPRKALVRGQETKAPAPFFIPSRAGACRGPHWDLPSQFETEAFPPIADRE